MWVTQPKQTPWGLAFGRELRPWPEQGHPNPLRRDQFCPGTKMPLANETYLTIVGGIDDPDGRPVEVKLLGNDIVQEGTRYELIRLLIEDTEGNVWWVSESRFRNEFRRGRLA